mmetsp:Transcript_22679/g.73762  ORF Transcript_22679/g.73762 Transcript_22679/m.73762 type:complete len:210 (+) Transcript_22679:1114-1743(+)
MAAAPALPRGPSKPAKPPPPPSACPEDLAVSAMTPSPSDSLLSSLGSAALAVSRRAPMPFCQSPWRCSTVSWLFRALKLLSWSPYTMCASSCRRVSMIRLYFLNPLRSSVRSRSEISSPCPRLYPKMHISETPTFPSGGISVSSRTVHRCLFITCTTPGSAASRCSNRSAADGGGVSCIPSRGSSTLKALNVYGPGGSTTLPDEEALLR